MSDPHGWLRRHQFTDTQIAQVEGTFISSGHAFDVATLEAVGVAQLRDAVAPDPAAASPGMRAPPALPSEGARGGTPPRMGRQRSRTTQRVNTSGATRSQSARYSPEQDEELQELLSARTQLQDALADPNPPPQVVAQGDDLRQLLVEVESKIQGIESGQLMGRGRADGAEARTWLRGHLFTDEQIDQVENTMISQGHSFDLDTLGGLDVNELREALSTVQSDPRAWLLSHQFTPEQVNAVAETLENAGRSFDMQVLQKLDLEDLRDVATSMAPNRNQRDRMKTHSQLSRMSSMDGNDRGGGPLSGDASGQYIALRRMRMALLVFKHGTGNLLQHHAGQPLHNSSDALSDILAEIKALDMGEAEDLLQEVDIRIEKMQEEPPHLQQQYVGMGEGRVTIHNDGNERGVILRNFDVAQFSKWCENDAYVSETDAIILSATDEAPEEQDLVGKIAIIDMRIWRPAGAAKATQTADGAVDETEDLTAKFPCERAFAAQAAGVCAVVFVYPHNKLRGKMLPLQVDPVIWIPCVAISLSDTNGFLVRKQGQLWFDEMSDGKPIEVRANRKNRKKRKKASLALSSKSSKSNSDGEDEENEEEEKEEEEDDDDEDGDEEKEQDEDEDAEFDEDDEEEFDEKDYDDIEDKPLGSKEKERFQRTCTVSLQFDRVYAVRKSCETLFKAHSRTQQSLIENGVIATVAIGDLVTHNGNQTEHDRHHFVTDFFDSHPAKVIGVWTGRGANAGLFTIELRNHEGLAKGVSMLDVFVQERPTELQRMLRYGSKKMVNEFLNRTQHKNFFNSNETDSSENTLLHLLFSNPNISLKMIKEAHKLVWKGKKMTVHKMSNSADLTPMHCLCGNTVLVASVLKYVLVNMCTDPAKAILTQPDPTKDQDRFQASYRAPSPVHVYASGLALDVKVLQLLFNIHDDKDCAWGRFGALLSDDGVLRNVQQTFATKEIAGEQPLHRAMYWPHIRVNHAAISVLFMACPAVARMRITGRPKSSPLHRAFTYLKQAEDDFERRATTTHRSSHSVWVGYLDSGLANQHSVGEFMLPLGHIHQISVRVKPGSDTSWAVVEFSSQLDAQKAIDRREIHPEGSADPITLKRYNPVQVKSGMARAFVSGNQKSDRIEKITMDMLYQVRGLWTSQETDPMVEGGLMDNINHWTVDAWQPAPVSGLEPGTFVAVDNKFGRKGVVVSDNRPAEQTVEIRIYKIGENTVFADKEAEYEDVNTSESAILVCPLSRFLGNSNNAFELIFNLILYNRDFKTRGKISTEERHKGLRVAAILEGVAGRLAQWMPLRCSDSDEVTYRLSRMLLQPSLVPFALSDHDESYWQLTGGIAEASGATVTGPLWAAVKYHVSAFTSSEWVESYVEHARFDGILREALDDRGEDFFHGPSATFQEVAEKLLLTSVYRGWSISYIHYIGHTLLTRDELVDLPANEFLISAMCCVCNPRTAFQAPRALWWLHLFCQLVFLFVFTWTWTMQEGDAAVSTRHRIEGDKVGDCMHTLWFPTNDVAQDGEGVPRDCWSLKRIAGPVLGQFYETEFYTILTAAGMLAQAILQLLRPNKIADFWSQVDIFNAVLITAGTAMMRVHYFAALGYYVQSFVGLLLWIRLFEYLQDSSSVGPLVGVLGRMAQITLNFLILIMVTLMGFAFIMTALYKSHYPSRSFGEIGIAGSYDDLTQTTWTLFKVLLGEAELNFAGEEREVALTVVFAVYVFVMVVLMLNLLIAVLSSAHTEVADTINEEVSYMKSVVTINAQEATNLSLVPPPFNLLQIVYPSKQRKRVWNLFVILVGLPVAVLVSSLTWFFLAPIYLKEHIQAHLRVPSDESKFLCWTIAKSWFGLPFFIIWAVLQWLEGLLCATFALVSGLFDAAKSADDEPGEVEEDDQQQERVNVFEKEEEGKQKTHQDARRSEGMQLVRKLIDGDNQTGTSWEGAIFEAVVASEFNNANLQQSVNRIQQDVLHMKTIVEENNRRNERRMDALFANLMPNEMSG